MGTGVAPTLWSPAMLMVRIYWKARDRGGRKMPHGVRVHRWLRALRWGIRVRVYANPTVSSQATRAIRTAALGGSRDPSTGGLLTWWSPTALQRARGSGSVHLGACF